MNEVLIYIGKVILIQGVFYGCYRLVLKNSLQHAWNRMYLIIVLLLSFVIPFIKTETPQVIEQWPAEQVIVWVQEATTELVMMPAGVEEVPSVSYGWILPAIYFVIVGFLIIRSVLYLFFLQKLKKQSDYVKKHWYKLFKTSQPRPFSFFSSIFMPGTLFGSDAFDQILTHECVHVKQRHSFDRLLLDFLVSLFWFNPFIYWYRNALIEIHEYQADEAVLKTYNDPVGYQEILYEQLQTASYSGLVSHFNFSMIKKRIVMMNKQKNTHTRWAYLLTVPVLLSVIFAFSTKEAIAPIEEVGSEIVGMLGPASDFSFPEINFSAYAQGTNEPSIMPVKSDDLVRLSSGFGMRMHPIYKVRKMHLGADFACKEGSQILATADGVVEKVQTRSEGYGKQVVIDHGNGFKTRYAQLSEFKVKVGDEIKKGEVIALSGNSGSSTAPHLHYEIKKGDKHVDPMDYIQDFKPKPVIKEIPGTSTKQSGTKEAGSSQDQDVQAVVKYLEENEDNGNATLRLPGIEKEPLLIMNGEKVTRNLLWLLGPDDIKEITVYRPDKAFSKYGEDGKNGVVELITKPYQNESLAYIYKGKLLYDFSFDQIEEEHANIQMVSPRYLDIELPDRIKNVYVINDPETSRRVSEKVRMEEERLWAGIPREVEEDTLNPKQKRQVEEQIENDQIKFDDGKQERSLNIREVGGKDPLFVVDGEIVGDVDDLIDPQNIKSITVLKGISAIKKYGTKGSDGVVEITTKNKSKEKNKNKNKSDNKDKKQAFRVIIDAGHGGKDSGAESPNGHEEKDIVLSIAKKIRDYFRNDQVVEIVLTREDDDFLDLEDRSNLTKNANLLISIHTDNYEGKGSFILPIYNDKNEYAEASYDLAQTLAIKFEEGGKSAQVGYSSGYYILNNAKCPAVLLNVGWFSDSEEDTYLASVSGQTKVARQISDAIKASVL